MKEHPLSSSVRLGRILGVAIVAGLIGFVSVATLSWAGDLPGDPTPATEHLYAFPGGQVLVPLGAGQPNELFRREAYKAVVESVYEYDDVAWTAQAATHAGETFAAGTAVAPVSGNFYRTTVGGSGFDPGRSYGLHPLKIAVFYSSLRDEFDQTVTWEEGNFEQLFRVYLWGQDYFDPISEAVIAAGGLDGYDLLILPAIRIGWADDVVDELGSAGLDEIRAFVEVGGSLYAQADSAFLAEAAGLVPEGTVDLDTRLTDADNVGQLVIDDPSHPLTFGWLDDSTYVLNEPVFSQTAGTTLVAHYYADTTHPGSPAILTARPGDGRAILMSGHPSDQQDTLPQVMDVLLWTMGQPAGIHGSLKQGYSAAVPDDVIPAFEVVPVIITTTFRNYWNTDLTNVVITETLHQSFTVALVDIIPAPSALLTGADGTSIIVWQMPAISPGDTVFHYTAWSKPNALAKGSIKVSSAQAAYTDPNDAYRPYTMRRNSLHVSAKMAARLNGDRDIELDGGYPLPAEGWFYDLALTLENKEETQAKNVVVTDVVALLSPIVDVDDQNLLSHVVTDTLGTGAEDQSLWVVNEFFFYLTPVELYPLPTIDGVTATVGITYTLAHKNGTYTLPGPFTDTAGLSNTVTISTGLSGHVTLNPDGSLSVPALVMVWDFGGFQGYDHLDPAIRYGLFSQEYEGRQVSFASDPMTDTGVVASGSGGSVWTNIGGHPIPYHEYLQSGIVVVPTATERARVDYLDIWNRPQTLTLRTVFYDIVPFPPPEFHAVVNTTFEMKADRNGDGTGETRVLDSPSREGVDLRLYLKSHSNFAEPLNLNQDETLISQGMFHGLGFNLQPRSGDWATSWTSLNLQGKSLDPTILTDTIEVPGYTYLYFQQALDPQAYEGIYIDATLAGYGGFHREGVMKIDDGARFVYHQKALGPSRYEVFDSHVQAVFGLSADAGVDKQVAPVLVATYDDQVYHFVKIEDPYDPRHFGYRPFIKSYGFFDLAATVYVGGRHGPELLYPRVAPGGHTQVRLEIRNNSGVTLTNLNITPVAPAGITVTQRSTVETRAIEPLFFDFPFLHLDEVPDAWKTVYYYDVQVDPGFSDTGWTHPINFNVTAGGLPGDFQVPAALLGVGADGSTIKTIYGQATGMQLTDVIPPYVTLLDARIGNTTEITAIVADLAVGDDVSAEAKFQSLRNSGVSFTKNPVDDGTEVHFSLTASGNDDPTQMPWIDNGVRSNELWVVFKSQANINRSGTNIINYGPGIGYTDDFLQVYTDTGPDVTVEAHGAVVSVTYTVEELTDIGGRSANGIVIDEENIAYVSVSAHNRGDYIAADTVITVALASNVVISETTRPPVAEGSGSVTFDLGDIAPNETKSVRLTMRFLPTSSGITPLAPPYSWRLIERTDGRFINKYVNTLVVAQLANELEVGSGTKDISSIYLPSVQKAWQPTWPDLVITHFSLDPGSPAADQPVTVQITVLNQGETDAGPFWVDFYVDPAPVPTHANQLWYEVCHENCIGIAWLVDGLGVGQSLTLTSLGGYSDKHTIWPGYLPGGTHNLYGYVDTWNPGVSTGGVAESDETNNRADMPGVVVSGQAAAGQAQPAGLSVIAPRPAP